MRYFLARLQRGAGRHPGYSAGMIPILGSMVSPPCVATGINAWIAARHSGASCSRFGSLAMKLPASRKVCSSPLWVAGLNRVRGGANLCQASIVVSYLPPLLDLEFSGSPGSVFSSSRLLLAGHGSPGAPQPHARGPSHGLSGWVSQTKQQLSQRAQNRIRLLQGHIPIN